MEAQIFLNGAYRCDFERIAVIRHQKEIRMVAACQFETARADAASAFCRAEQMPDEFERHQFLARTLRPGKQIGAADPVLLPGVLLRFVQQFGQQRLGAFLPQNAVKHGHRPGAILKGASVAKHCAISRSSSAGGRVASKI